ncbi:hypothetical protein YH65_08095 [Sulfurovum lithotrophicum]|uniref:Uncharacterized protein n=1 Tax=Sulfurovum lithotrophicum TaxID=206403 RepID=A0A7U4M1Y9_9BACT|nr:hypothetical protein [Sulfurovum lithotrophicum]AKF25352.1 hypothetical protein YH65_08095 [Sulfurovum lithotrophicum]
MKYLLMIVSVALLFTGCIEQSPKVNKAPVKAKETNATSYVAPPPPKKHIKLKEVQDDNYSPEYMYPDDKYKKDKLVEAKGDSTAAEAIEKAAASMSRAECISMIGQEKFDKYTQMYGNEEASIKRCTLLKSIQKG